MIPRVARRAIVPVALIAGAVVVVAVVAALAGSSASRATALGLYAVGAGLGIFGFALGSRNLLFRPLDHGADEEEDVSAPSETREAAVLLIVVGLVLLAVGAAVDPRARLI